MSQAARDCVDICRYLGRRYISSGSGGSRRRLVNTSTLCGQATSVPAEHSTTPRINADTGILQLCAVVSLVGVKHPV